MVVGTVGEPGSRSFFLQVRQEVRLATVGMEKIQVATLAERMDELLDELMGEQTSTVIPAIAPLDLADNDPLEQPIEQEFQAGSMTLAWDPGTEEVVIEVFPFREGAAEDAARAEEAAAQGEELSVVELEDPEEYLLVRLSAARARAFIERTQLVVAAGRPDCPFCGEAIDPEGHLCVRANGFKRRAG